MPNVAASPYRAFHHVVFSGCNQGRMHDDASMHYTVTWLVCYGTGAARLLVALTFGRHQCAAITRLRLAPSRVSPS